ncbi:unnamed protein product [Sphagnum tenellum]
MVRVASLLKRRLQRRFGRLLTIFSFLWLCSVLTLCPEIPGASATAEPAALHVSHATTSDTLGSRGLPRPSAEERVLFNMSLEAHVLFRPEGKAASHFVGGHLAFTRSFAHIDDSFDDFAEKRKSLDKYIESMPKGSGFRSKVEESKARWERHIEILLGEWSDSRILLTSNSDAETLIHRVKRWVTGVIFGIVGFFSMMISLFNVSEVQKVIAASETGGGTASADIAHKFLVTKLQKLTDRMGAAEERLEQQEIIFFQLEKQFNTYWGVQAYDHYLRDGYLQLKDEVRAASIAIVALHHNHVTPQLVNTSTLEIAIGHLRAVAAVQGLIMPDPSASFAYTLPVQFVRRPNLTVSFIIHTPLISALDKFELYRFVDVPIALTNSVHSVSITPEAPYLAINTDRTGFVFISTDELRDCLRIGDTRICQNLNYMLRESDSYCLSALFLQSQAATKVCPITIIPSAFKVAQLSQTEFYCFHPYHALVRVECPENHSAEEAIAYRGARLLTIPPGCSGRSPGYVARATEDLFVSGTILQKTTHWRLGQLIANISLAALDYMLPVPPKRPVAVEDIQREYAELVKPMTAWTFSLPWHWTLGMSLTSTILLIVAAGSCAFCCRGPLRDCMECAGRNLSRAGSLASIPGWPEDPPRYHDVLDDEGVERQPRGGRRRRSLDAFNAAAVRFRESFRAGTRQMTANAARLSSRWSSRLSLGRGEANPADESAGRLRPILRPGTPTPGRAARLLRVRPTTLDLEKPMRLEPFLPHIDPPGTTYGQPGEDQDLILTVGGAIAR